MLETVSLTKIYEDGVTAVDGLCLRVDDGEIYCLLGANGAGKTTTINMFLGFITPSAGLARIDGIDVASDPLGAKRRLAYVPESVMLYGSLTASQNLSLFARLSGRDDIRPQDYASYARKVGLVEAALGKRVKQFSKGMRQKLALAIALVRGAGNLLLDEPTSGLDPKAARDLTETLLELRGQGKAVLVSTHDVFRARDIADKIGIMREGRLVGELTASDLQGQDLEEIYLEHMKGVASSEERSGRKERGE